jgi:excisionase family DNA binding protein
MKDLRTHSQQLSNALSTEALFTRAEVAEIFGCAESTVTRWVKEGRLKATRPTQRTVRISQREIARFVQATTG